MSINGLFYCSKGMQTFYSESSFNNKALSVGKFPSQLDFVS